MRYRLIVIFIALIQLTWTAGEVQASDVTSKVEDPSHSRRRADGHEVVAEIRARIVKAFVSGDFKTLEHIASAFQPSTEVTPFGNPKNYTFFEVGILGAVDDFAAEDQADWDKVLRQADDWMRAYPDSPAAILSKSEILIARAWKIRGRGYADSVSESSFRRFGESIQAAHDLLTSTRAVSSRNPDWYRQMIEISNYLPLDKSVLMSLSDEAERRFPSYFRTFDEGLEYMLPRWHGSDEEVKDYVDHVTKAAPAELADVLYARLYIGASCCAYKSTDLYKLAGADWPRLKKGVELLHAKFPIEPYIDIEANFACRAGDVKTLRSLLPQIGDEPELEWWSNWRPMFESCVQMAKTVPANVDHVPVLEGPPPTSSTRTAN